MNDLTPYERASGQRVNGGKAGLWFDDGKGKLDCHKAPQVGIDSHLLKLAERVVTDLGLTFLIFSVDTGHHVVGSRHYEGRAIDVTEIAPYGSNPVTATLKNPHAIQVVEHLIACGFHAGHEAGAYPAVLFGPVGTKYNATRIPHANHLHMSIYK